VAAFGFGPGTLRGALAMNSSTIELLTMTVFRALYLGAIAGALVGDLIELLGLLRDQAESSDW
jgi:hypothetical protein